MKVRLAVATALSRRELASQQIEPVCTPTARRRYSAAIAAFGKEGGLESAPPLVRRPSGPATAQHAIAWRRQTPESISQRASRMRVTAVETGAALLSLTYSESIWRSAAECSRSASTWTL